MREATSTSSRPVMVLVAHLATELLVGAAVFWGASRLAGWPWSALGYVALFAGWAALLTLGSWLRAKGWRGVPALEIFGGGMILGAAASLHATVPITAVQGVYSLGFVGVATGAWRCWRDGSADVANEPVAEPLRVLLVAAAALGVMLPMFTNRFLGGTDARWYTLMLHDFIEQWRTSGPPVFLGQGEFVWVGAVHPFRSAPVYMHVAGLWDWLTLRTLETEALQHLTAITAALAGAIGSYAAGVKLAPQRRWAVASVAMMYTMSSAALTPLYFADAYMTYMASAVFVWVFYGNARILVDGRGWLSLAGGLSLAWMSHPPTAMQVTLLTSFLQTGGLVFRQGTWKDWSRAVGGAVLFVLLSAYYFAGMSELPQPPRTGLRSEVLQVVSLLMGWAAIAQILLMRRSWPWGFVLLGAVGVQWIACPPWAAWLVLLVLVLIVVRGITWKWGRFDPAGREPLVLLAGIVLTSFIMDALLRSGPLAKAGYPAASLQWAEAWSAFQANPLKTLFGGAEPFEPGWGLWGGGLLAGIAATRRRDVTTQLLFAAILLMCPLVMHLPRAGDFLVEYVPRELRNMTAAPMHLRTMPVLAALLAVGTITALRVGVTGKSRLVRGMIGGVVVLAVGWYAWQARLFVQRGFGVTSSAELSAKNRRTENAAMDRFVYDLLPIPSYFSHGKMDARLEARLLDDAGNLIYGPPQMVEAMEGAGSQVVQLDTFPVSHRADWLQIEPHLVLQPGEHRLLRFEFNPSVRMAGYLLFQSEHGYREYTLPESGYSRAFGAGDQSSRIVSLWNSGTTVEHYQMQFAMLPGNELGPGMNFARLTLAAFDPARSLIEVKSLNPWRAETRMPWSGQLETPRVYLPGYEVRVDGRRIGSSRISASRDRLLQIAMPPGEHAVEVRYTGTWTLRIAGVVSLMAWVTVFVFLLRKRGATQAPVEVAF